KDVLKAVKSIKKSNEDKNVHKSEVKTTPESAKKKRNNKKDSRNDLCSLSIETSSQQQDT
ncbi:6378_t:CDS:1, partial [Dentiscutata heterogama]